MQLFVLLSGLTARDEIDTIEKYITLVKRRSVQLLLPYFSFTILKALIVPGNSFINHFTSYLLYPTQTFWFLWVLFFDYMIFASAIFISNKIKSNKYICFIIFFCYTAVVSRFSHGLFNIGGILNFYISFIIGYTLSHTIKIWSFILSLQQRNKQNPIIVTFCTIMWCVMLLCYLNSDIISIVFSSYPYRIILALGGCVMWIMFFSYISGICSISILNNLGKATLGIYTLHILIIDAVIGRSLDVIWSVMLKYNILQFIIWTVLLSAVSYVLTNALQKSKYLSLVFLGKAI